MEVINNSGICYECKKPYNKGLQINFNKKFFNKINLCNCCACKMYSLLAKSFIPKSPQNINSKLKEKN